MSGEFLHRTGAWLGVQAKYIHHAGIWKSILQEWTKVAGVWKLGYAAVTAVIANSGVAGGESDSQGLHGGGTSSATLTFNSDGSISKVGSAFNNNSGSSAWLANIGAGNGAPYWLRATVISGALTGGSVTGVWLACNINRAFINQHTIATGGGNWNCRLSIDFASDAAGVTIVSAGNIWDVNVIITIP